MYVAFEISGWRPFSDAVILGDSINPCSWWLIPQMQGRVVGVQAAFNKVHQSTRAIVERSFGIMKNWFPVVRSIRLKHLKTPVN